MAQRALILAGGGLSIGFHASSLFQHEEIADDFRVVANAEYVSLPGL